MQGDKMWTATVTHLARSKALPLSYGEKLIHLHMITILTNTELPAHFLDFAFALIQSSIASFKALGKALMRW
jgi:hypothetical protein